MLHALAVVSHAVSVAAGGCFCHASQDHYDDRNIEGRFYAVRGEYRFHPASWFFVGASTAFEHLYRNDYSTPSPIAAFLIGPSVGVRGRVYGAERVTLGLRLSGGYVYAYSPSWLDTAKAANAHNRGTYFDLDGELAYKAGDRVEVVLSLALMSRRQLRYADGGGPYDKPRWRYGTSLLPLYPFMMTAGVRLYL